MDARRACLDVYGLQVCHPVEWRGSPLPALRWGELVRDDATCQRADSDQGVPDADHQARPWPPLWKGKDGEQRQSDGTWASVHQVVDRSTHRYRKQVVRDDGTVVRDVDEPLQEHRDRGDARPDRRKAKGPG